LGSNLTPENFTVLVGERWVASIETRDDMENTFYTGFRQQLPSFVRPIFPYRLTWALLMGVTDTYIGAIEHEAFHAYEGMTVPSHLAAAENAMKYEDQYPWDEAAFNKAWQSELDLLVRAVQAKTDDEARDLAQQFLSTRDARRSAAHLDPALADFERQREWLEGLAKYVELEIGRVANQTPSYKPLPAMAADPSFKSYSTRERFWSQQLGEVRRMTNRPGEVRFYYSGMAQAALLDRLSPGWKEGALKGNAGTTANEAALEGLLREAVKN
jgi:hypothetical protein